MSDPNAPLLEVKGLKTYFFTREGTVQAVDDVSFYVNRGEVLGLVGESGCGKSVTSLSILRLVPYPGRVVDGEIWFGGRNLLDLDLDEMPEVPRQADRHDLSAAPVVAQSGLSGRRADRGGDGDPSRPLGRGHPETGDRAC